MGVMDSCVLVRLTHEEYIEKIVNEKNECD